MIYKGFRFRETHRVCNLPKEYQRNETDVAFGRMCPQKTKGAIKTNYFWHNPYPTDKPDENGKFPIYAKQIESDGYSRTNMMYGKDGKIYLMYDGRFYIASRRKK